MEKIIIKSKSDYNKFVKDLKSFARGESVEDKQRHIAIINTKLDVLCLPMKIIREVAAKISAGEPLEFLKYAGDGSYEEILIQGLVIAKLKDLNLQIKLFDKWVHKIDCWALVDSTVSTNKNLKNSKNKANYFDYYYNLCFSEKEFNSRFGIINLMTNFMEEDYIGRILEMCKLVKNDAYYVQMGIAWLISVAFVYFRDKTLSLLKEQSLSKFVQNKSISKCRDSFRVSKEDKDMLAKLRI